MDTLPWPHPIWEEAYAVHLTELIIIISLMGSGLKIDQRFSLTQWKIPFRLVTVTMVLSIAMVGVTSWWMLGLVAGLLHMLTWKMALFGLACVLLIRPAAGLAALLGAPMHAKEKLAISFFGIKGIGAFFYLAFALHQASFRYERELWSVVGFCVLVSLTVHGVTAPSSIARLREQFEQPVE